MWPWEHLAVGYLTLSVLWRARGLAVDSRLACALAVGTQFPDLVDKPLAWQFGILPAPRTLTHSLFVAVPLSVLVVVVATRRQRSGGVAFVVGYLTHLLGDALPLLLAGYHRHLAFLLWPVLPLPPDQGEQAVLGRLRAIIASPEPYLTSGSYRTIVVYFVVVLWLVDGAPVATEVGRLLQRARLRLRNR